jgi:hypothetical protein
MPDFEDFVRRFQHAWDTFNESPDAYADLFHPDGRFWGPDLRRWARKDEVGELAAAMKEYVTDVKFTVVDWAARGEVVYIEYICTAMVNGEHLEMPCIDRFTLRDNRAIEELVMFDSLMVWERIDPTMKRGALFGATES